MQQDTQPEPSSSDVSLYCVVARANKFKRIALSSMCKVKISNFNEVIGYIHHSRFKEFRNLPGRSGMFVFANEGASTLTLLPAPFEASLAERFKESMRIVAEENNERFKGCFTSWLNKDEAARDWYPVVMSDRRADGMCVPPAMRGLLGLITVGVHLNVYTTVGEGPEKRVDKIWVAKRATADNICYSGMLDQVVAGGMEEKDRTFFSLERPAGQLCPTFTLYREAMEEANLELNVLSKEVRVREADGKKTLIGFVQNIAGHLPFYDRKDRSAGAESEGHLEPGIRFAYDLEVWEPTYRPSTKDRSIESFEAFTVDEVKGQLRADLWKPNSGLVMLDFLVRHGYVTKKNDPMFKDIREEIWRPLPFPCVDEWCNGLYS